RDAGADPLAVARGYRTRIAAQLGADLDGVGWCTDKMWQNFERVAWLRRAFPGALIVHCTRHPMAVGWSIFQRAFGAAPPPFVSDLGDIAQYIAHHDALMDAWDALGAPGTVRVCYETLVENFEPEVTRLLGKLGLDLHPACLAFHQQRRVVTTQSFGQVSQPLYRSALARWRRYETHLAPMADALERLGLDPDPAPP
ncbi:MAG: sulfotransferase, partial [Pseudomonadota bacterium]